jgi:hypothetical protein
MKLINKPLLDVHRERGILCHKESGMNFDLAKIAPDNTQVFVLSPEVALAAETMARSKTFRMPEFTDLKFPYPHMAIELPLTPAIRALRSDGMDGTFPVNRVALRIDSNSTHLNCFTYWGYENNLIEPPFFSYAMGDFSPIVNYHFPLVRLKALNNPDSFTEFQVLPSKCLLDAMMGANIPHENLSKMFRLNHNLETIVTEAICELPTLLFACTLLLNCKNGIGKTRIDAKTPPFKSGYGAKKRKQYSSSAYTLLYLEEVETVTPDGVVNTRSDISAHYVRGHFKQRDSGIYWWNSFVRGKGNPNQRTAYIVSDKEE